MGVKQELGQLKRGETGGIKRKRYLFIKTNFLNISGAKVFLLWTNPMTGRRIAKI